MLQTVSKVFIFLFLWNAHAEPMPDVYCRPAKVVDAGYELELTRNDQEGYFGDLDQIRISGEIPMYRGGVNMEMVHPGRACEIKIENKSQSSDGSFEMKIFEGGYYRIYKVGGKEINAREGVMHCYFSQTFLRDVLALCRNN